MAAKKKRKVHSNKGVSQPARAGVGRRPLGAPPEPAPRPIEKVMLDLTRSEQEEVVRLLTSLDRDLRRLRYLSDYPAFVTDCLGLGFIPGFKDPGVQAWLKEYGDFLLDHIATRSEAEHRYQIMVIVPRECMKSTAVTGPTHIWLHLQDPEYAGMISSANYDKMAKKFAGTARSLMSARHSELYELFGPFESTHKWTDEHMVSRHRKGSRGDPTLKPFSVETGATSGHFNGGTLDDPVTEMQVVKFADSWWPKLYAHYNSLDFVINKEGLLTLIGTRYGEQDLFGYIIENEISPAVEKALGHLPDDFEARWDHYANLHSKWHVILRKVHAEDGTNCFPVIWPDARCEEVRQRGETGESYYSCQLQNEPAKRKDNPIQPDHIERWWFGNLDEVPAGAFNRLTLQMDTAWKSEKAYLAQSGDWNVIQLWAHHKGHVYLIDQWHGRVTQQLFGQQLVRILQNCQKQYGRLPQVMTYDKPVGGQGTSNRDWFISVCHEAGLPCPAIEEISRSGINKLGSILAIAGHIQNGMVHVLRSLQGARELAREATHVGFSKHDDHMDALKDVFHDKVYIPQRRSKQSANERKIIPFESLFHQQDDPAFEPERRGIGLFGGH